MPRKQRCRPSCCGFKRQLSRVELIDGEYVCKDGMGCKEGKKIKSVPPPKEIQPMPSISLDYCGKMMYSEEEAKKVVKKVEELKGYYFCENCQAYHVTRQSQTPERQQWFKDHPKMYRNKHR